MDTPIVIVMFNRPQCVKKLLERIGIVKPKRLFVISDGPRENVQSDYQLVKECQQIVDKMVSWPCEIHKIYATENLGCGRRLPTGLDEVFKLVDRAIILEDDCIPEVTFFRYCEELLEKYYSDTRIYSISGNNFFQHEESTNSYFFSIFPQTCGWATWRRVWQEYDYEIKKWPTFRDAKVFKNLFNDYRFTNILEKVFQACYDKVCLTAWDYQFSFLSFCNHGLNIIPAVNLIKNIGFDESATHIKDSECALAKMMSITKPISFPLDHPYIYQENFNYDRKCWCIWGYEEGDVKYYLKRSLSLLKKILKRIYMQVKFSQ